MTATNKNVRALLISSPWIDARKQYLRHVESTVLAFLGPIKRVLFVPFALKGWEEYTELARVPFAAHGIEFNSIHQYPSNRDIRARIERDTAIFVGGGNTFRLLKILRQLHLLEIIGSYAQQGVPYIGVSAGTNLACPTIMTTNDMPIVDAGSLDALGLVPYQINTHYVDGAIADGHMGETREERINEFHEENNVPIIGLREASWILMEQGISTLGGPSAARLFLPGYAAEFEGARTIEAEIEYARTQVQQ